MKNKNKTEINRMNKNRAKKKRTKKKKTRLLKNNNNKNKAKKNQLKRNKGHKNGKRNKGRRTNKMNSIARSTFPGICIKNAMQFLSTKNSFAANFIKQFSRTKRFAGAILSCQNSDVISGSGCLDALI